MRKFAFDIKLMRPGCVNVQAGLGGDSRICHFFDTKDWLTAPTDDMRLYPIEDDQIPLLVAKVEAARNDSSHPAN